MPRGVSRVDEARLQGRLWTPAVLRPSAWFDAADLSTITVATGISEWRDKSGFGNHVSQATGADQPAYTVRGLNGLNVITFDGSRDFLTNSTYSFPTVYSIYAVGRSNALSYARLLNVGETTDTTGFVGSNSNNYATFFGNQVTWNDVTANTPNQSVTSTSILGIVKDNAVGGAVPYFNGTAQNTKNGTTVSATGFVLGRGTVGAGSANQRWNGIIAETIILPALSTTAQRQSIEGYLAWKWGLVANLPAAHPFKNRPPVI